jgi:hypothetical protein
VPALNASSLLYAWETGASQPPVRRALTLLSVAFPEVSPSEWARHRIGERDRYLIALREELFGTHMETVAQCPQCSERLEMNFETRDIAVAPAPGADQGLLRVASEGLEIEFRLPASEDLLAVANSPDPCAELLRRCIAHPELSIIPKQALVAVIGAMAEADPQADLRVDLACPACGHGWQKVFDVAAYLWSEIEEWAQSTLRDVHVLASAYGWRERDVLALTAARRRLYVQMVVG